MTDSPDQYTFAVSLKTYTENTDDRRNTGLQWEECIYIKDEKPGAPQKLSLISTSEDKTLSVYLERLDCQSGSPFIIKYTVYYCMTQEKKICKGTKHQKDMQREGGFLKLNNLEAEQQYGFWVTASSDMGEGPESDWIYGTPSDNNLTGGEIVGIMIGGLFVLVLAVAGAVFTLRYIKTKRFSIPPIEVPDTLPVYINIPMIQSPQIWKNPESLKKDADNVGDSEHFIQGHTGTESDMKPDINIDVKCNSESSLPDSQHPEIEVITNIQHVINHKLSAVPTVSDYVQSIGHVKSSSQRNKPNRQGQLEAVDCILGVSQHQSTLVNCIAQSKPDVSNYVSNVTNPEWVPVASNSMGHSSVSNCFTGIKTPPTVSEGESFVINDVISVFQIQKMLADRSTKGQPTVSGYVSNVMNSFLLTGNSNSENELSVLASYPNSSSSQPVSTSMNTQCQSSVSGYVTSVINPHLPPPNNKPLLQSAVNDHVFSTQSKPAHSNNQSSMSQ
ncbi:hypothetical protein CHS0354_026567 [Potamilus streckersoni]|uniref:Fibronectin type-III domain-containing protein n=1 Tax=Potamilus streckersoni TaxID=2493646 RepID=A0AAE0RQ70_9BIVA|nr:hypothetical protein CHS0354_026567 [Potamilus streckersoni]